MRILISNPFRASVDAILPAERDAAGVKSLMHRTKTKKKKQKRILIYIVSKSIGRKVRGCLLTC